MKKTYISPQIEVISYNVNTSIASCWDLAGWVIGGEVTECKTHLYSTEDCIQAKLAS